MKKPLAVVTRGEFLPARDTESGRFRPGLQRRLRLFDQIRPSPPVARIWAPATRPWTRAFSIFIVTWRRARSRTSWMAGSSGATRGKGSGLRFCTSTVPRLRDCTNPDSARTIRGCPRLAFSLPALKERIPARIYNRCIVLSWPPMRALLLVLVLFLPCGMMAQSPAAHSGTIAAGASLRQPHRPAEPGLDQRSCPGSSEPASCIVRLYAHQPRRSAVCARPLGAALPPFSLPAPARFAWRRRWMRTT